MEAKKSSLELIRQGVKGGDSKYSNEGRTLLIIDTETRMEVDAFQGAGDTYGRRDECLVTLKKGDETIFAGTADELIRRLKK